MEPNSENKSLILARTMLDIDSGVIKNADILTDKKYGFRYIKKKQFHINRPKNAKIAGYIKRRACKPENAEDEFDRKHVYLYQESFDEKKSYFKFHKKPPAKWRTRGYVFIGDGEWAAVYRSLIPFLLILFTLSAAIAMMLMNPDSLPKPIRDALQFEDGDARPLPPPSDYKPDMMDIPVYGETTLDGKQTASRNGRAIELKNPRGNTVYFCYRVKNGKKTIFETKAIKPGNMVIADIYDKLPKGETQLSLEIDTYDVKTETSCNASVVNMTVIKK